MQTPAVAGAGEKPEMNRSSTSADGGEGRSDHGERPTRLSAVWTALAVAIVALAAILVFILENPQNVDLSFLMFHGRLPLAIALLFAMMLGAVIVLGSGTARILQLRGVARRARRTAANAEAASRGDRPPVTAEAP
jgi:putative membrane protein